MKPNHIVELLVIVHLVTHYFKMSLLQCSWVILISINYRVRVCLLVASNCA